MPVILVLLFYLGGCAQQDNALALHVTLWALKFEFHKLHMQTLP